MKVKFIQDIKYDAFMVWFMLSTPDPEGNWPRAQRMGIDAEIFQRITGEKEYKHIKPFVLDIVKKVYKSRASEIRNSIRNYQKSWDRIGIMFSDEIERITQEKWCHSNYEVVVSPFHPGISTNGGYMVVTKAFETNGDQDRYTAHELLISHLWGILYEKYPEAKLDSDGHFWALSELATYAVLGLEPKLNAFWSERTKGYDEYFTNGYPQVYKLKALNKDIYRNAVNFDDYLEKMIEVLTKKKLG